MIVSNRDKRTQEFSEGKWIMACAAIERRAEMKLDQLDAAVSLCDLETSGNRLEALWGERKRSFSIRINDQWRVCFEWPDGLPSPVTVEIVEYR